MATVKIRKCDLRYLSRIIINSTNLEKKIESKEKQLSELADKIYLDLVAEYTDKYPHLLESNIPIIFPRNKRVTLYWEAISQECDDSINVQGDYYDLVSKTDKRLTLSFTEDKPIPYSIYIYTDNNGNRFKNSFFYIAKDNALIKQYEKVEDELNTLEKSKATQMREVEKSLSKYSSFKQLFNDWKEVEPILLPYYNERLASITAPPVVIQNKPSESVDKLNKLLGLSKNTKKKDKAK